MALTMQWTFGDLDLDFEASLQLGFSAYLHAVHSHAPRSSDWSSDNLGASEVHKIASVIARTLG